MTGAAMADEAAKRRTQAKMEGRIAMARKNEGNLLVVT
jgi:hypothetical protein